MDSQTPAPTTEEKEKICKWLASGVSEDRIDFLKSLTSIPYLKRKQNSAISASTSSAFTSSHIGNDKSIQNNDERETVSVASSSKTKVPIKKCRKRLQSQSSQSPNQSRTRSRSRSQTDSETGMGAPIRKFKKGKNIRPKSKTLRSTVISFARGRDGSQPLPPPSPNSLSIDRIPSTVVYINPSLNKVKLETDYIPEVKVEPQSQQDQDQGSQPEPGVSHTRAAAVSAASSSHSNQSNNNSNISEIEEAGNETSPQDKAFATDKILAKICTYLPSKDLLCCSLITKKWNTVSRTVLRDDRQCYASIDQFYPCRDLLTLNHIVEKSFNPCLPYNGLSFRQKSSMPNRLHSHGDTLSSSLNKQDLHALLLKIKFKYLHLNGTILTSCNQHCPAFKLVRKIMILFSSDLIGITLQPFYFPHITGLTQYLYEYETCPRKFFGGSLQGDITIINSEIGLPNLKLLEIMHEAIYEAKNNIIYFEILKSQVEQILHFAPNIEVIRAAAANVGGCGYICAELLPTFKAKGKIHAVQDLQVLQGWNPLICHSDEDGEFELSAKWKLNSVIDAANEGLQLRKLYMGSSFDFDANLNGSESKLKEAKSNPNGSDLCRETQGVTLALMRSSCSNLTQLSIRHWDLIVFFCPAVAISNNIVLPCLTELSVLTYDFKLDEDRRTRIEGLLMLNLVNFDVVFPSIKSLQVEVKKPLRKGSKFLNEIIDRSQKQYRQCMRVKRLQIDFRSTKPSTSGLSGCGWSKIIQAFVSSFPNVETFASDGSDNFEMLCLSLWKPAEQWLNLEVVRFTSVSLWELEQTNLDPAFMGNDTVKFKDLLKFTDKKMLQQFSERDYSSLVNLKKLKRLEIKLRQHCGIACHELRNNERDSDGFLSEMAGRLISIRTRERGFSVELNTKECTGYGFGGVSGEGSEASESGKCYYGALDHLKKIPGFLKHVNSFLD